MRWEVDDQTYPEYVRPADPVDNCTVAHGAWGMIGKVGIHIARHDPARVLREVEAKRQLLRYVCGELADDATDASAEWQLQILAAVWSDHPDYRQEWAP